MYIADAPRPFVNKISPWHGLRRGTSAAVAKSECQCGCGGKCGGWQENGYPAKNGLVDSPNLQSTRLQGGHHLILDLEGCDPLILNSKNAMIQLCRSVARIMGTKVLKSGSYKFSPQGVTAFVIIAESHVSVHTWPESGKAFVDVFTCQKHFDKERIVSFVAGTLGAKQGRMTLIRRKGWRSHPILAERVPLVPTEFDLGKTILSIRSNYQQIKLTKGAFGLSLFLDGYWQFVEKYEHIYHEMLVHPAMVCAPRLQRVGIAGGGDGLALREVVKYPQLGEAIMYELDPLVLAVADEHPEMRFLNQHALRHPKAQVVADDARKMLVPGANFDVLILDFPSISDGTKFSDLYSVPFYLRAKQALGPDGVLVTQVTDYSWNLLCTTENLRRLFPYVIPIDIGYHFSMFNFVLASNVPFQQRRRLPPNLKFVTPMRIAGLLSSAISEKVYEKSSPIHPRSAAT